MDAYTHGYAPQPGDVLWDAGTHAGASTPALFVERSCEILKRPQALRSTFNAHRA